MVSQTVLVSSLAAHVHRVKLSIDYALVVEMRQMLCINVIVLKSQFMVCK